MRHTARFDTEIASSIRRIFPQKNVSKKGVEHHRTTQQADKSIQLIRESSEAFRTCLIMRM